MNINIKRLCSDAVVPSYAMNGDAGMDLVAVTDPIYKKSYVEYETGIAIEIPSGYAGFIFPRSSVSKKDLILANCVGVIDSGYRGEIKIRFKDSNRVPDTIRTGDLGFYKKNHYLKGDRVAQLIILPVPQIEFTEVTELESSDRNKGSFGSTGS